MQAGEDILHAIASRQGKRMQAGEHRVRFDFEVDFSNGGGIQGQDFRLDIDGTDIDDRALADHVVRDMRLLMVESVRILNKRIIVEPHKRASTPRPERAAAGGRGDLVDLSHAVHSGEDVYPGLPPPRVSEHLSREACEGRYAPGVSFQIARIDMVANSGTAIDAPFHRYEEGADIADLALSAIADVPATVIHLGGMRGRAIGRDTLAAVEVEGRAVLLDTGWAARWGTTAYLHDCPFLGRDGAEYLRSRGACLVGIDALNIDDTGDPERPAHSILLAAGIPIVENLASLAALPETGARFSAVPMRIAGMGSFPVRAWARLT